jgi:hypothetical protein
MILSVAVLTLLLCLICLLLIPLLIWVCQGVAQRVDHARGVLTRGAPTRRHLDLKR